MTSLLAYHPIMATMTIRNLDDKIKRQLRITAALHGHSMEAAGIILSPALDTTTEQVDSGVACINDFTRLMQLLLFCLSAKKNREQRFFYQFILDANVIFELMRSPADPWQDSVN